MADRGGLRPRAGEGEHVGPDARPSPRGRPRAPRATAARRAARGRRRARASRPDRRGRASSGSSASASRPRCGSCPTRSARRSSSRTTAVSRSRSWPNGSASRSARSRAACSRGSRGSGSCSTKALWKGHGRADPRADGRVRPRRAGRGRARAYEAHSRVRALPRRARVVLGGDGLAGVRRRGAGAAARAARAAARAARASERPNVVPMRSRRWAVPVASAVAAVAAVVAIGLGLWASSLNSDLDEARSALAGQRAAVQVLADPMRARSAHGRRRQARRRRGSGEAALVVNGLEQPPDGKAYEIWVIRDGRPEPAGLFARGAWFHSTGPCRPTRRWPSPSRTTAARRSRRASRSSRRRSDAAPGAVGTSRHEVGTLSSTRAAGGPGTADRDRTLVRVHDLLPDLRRIFGFPAFRPGQERVVRAAVAGTDTLALMPTGSGKSLTYQLARCSGHARRSCFRR